MSWIKMRTDLRDHPKVVRMASALKADRLRVIGGLWAVWGTFDTHSVDGELEGYTLATLDEGIGWRGFSAALAAVRWLVETGDGLEIPEFAEHNGASAKRRATDAKRKASDREEDKGARGSWNSGGQMSASDADKKPPRVRVEKEKELPSEVGETREPQGTRNASPPIAADAAPPPKPPRIACPEGVDAAVWADWLTLRKAKRAPVTATVVQGARAEAAKAGMPLEAFLRVWCRRGSQGLEAAWLKPDERGASGNGRAPPPIDTAARNAESRRLLGFAPIPPTEPSGEIIDA